MHCVTGGTGLDLHLYESACEFALGGADNVIQNIAVGSTTNPLGLQKARVTPEGAIVKVTTLGKGRKNFKDNAMQFLSFVNCPAIQWLNITIDQVTIETIHK